MKKSDILGQRYGMLTVIEDSGKRKGSSVLWRCRCDCGGEILAVRHQLVSGAIQNCGCVPKPARKAASSLIGQRFGLLTVVEDSGQRVEGGVILWRCKCDCGSEILATRQQLVSGNVTNCGCIPKQYASKRQAEDLTGRQFGDLTALRRVENDKRGKVCWLCRCSCGKESVVQASQLKSGKTRSCGCKRYDTVYNKYDLTGQRFGRLTASYHLNKENHAESSFWHCRCDCGKEVDVATTSLVHGLTKSCGCWNKEQSSKMHDHMNYQDDTCVEVLKKACSTTDKNKAGFRGLFLTKSGKYRVMITFQKKHYALGYYKTFDEAVQARLDAESTLHAGYIAAFERHQEKAKLDPVWAESNHFYYRVKRENGAFCIETNSPD